MQPCMYLIIWRLYCKVGTRLEVKRRRTHHQNKRRHDMRFTEIYYYWMMRSCIVHMKWNWTQVNIPVPMVHVVSIHSRKLKNVMTAPVYNLTKRCYNNNRVEKTSGDRMQKLKIINFPNKTWKLISSWLKPCRWIIWTLFNTIPPTLSSSLPPHATHMHKCWNGMKYTLPKSIESTSA